MPHIGQIEYHYLTDGINWADGGGAFGLVPRVIWQERLPPDDLNRVPLHLRCLLVRAGGKTILIDTGLGTKLTPKQTQIFGFDQPAGGLLDNLAKMGVTPDQVDLVINTHLHADHCGGNTRLDPQSNRPTPTFPKAEYWVQRLEWADARYPNERTRATYMADNFAVLAETGQLRLLDGDTAVVEGVRTVVTRGHTRAHQSILLESEGELGFFVADLASLRFHFERTAWVTAYDVEPLENIETKRRWQRWAVETGSTVMFQHDPQIKTARLHRDGRHFKLEPFEP